MVPILSLFPAASAEGIEEVEPTWFQTAFEKVGEIPLATWIALGALLALSIVLLITGSRKHKWSATTIAFAALAIALSFLLSQIRLYRMPQGGSITAASMLPLMLFSYAFGLVPGLVSGLAFGILNFLQDPVLLPITPFYAVCQVALDYLLAYGCIGLAALFAKKFRKEALGLSAGIALVCVLRFACSLLSGVLFFAEYAGDQNVFLYSTLYNGSYMLPEMIICLAIGLLIGPRLTKVMRASAGIK
jgi:thiamine transporter